LLTSYGVHFFAGEKILFRGDGILINELTPFEGLLSGVSNFP